MKQKITLLTTLVFFALSWLPLIAAEVQWGGEIRVRYTQTDNAGFNDETHDTNSKVTQRTRINASFKLDEQTDAFVSIQDSRVWGEEKSTLSTAREQDEQTDISEAWLRIKNLLPTINLKVGRQFLLYGNKRLIAYSEWNEWGRRFDGAKLFYNSDKINLDVFFTKIKDPYAATKVDADDHFNGVYGNFKLSSALNMDVFLLQKEVDSDPKLEGQDFLTIGTYLRGKISGFDWSSEYASQMGKYKKDVDISAYYYAFNLGYTIKSLANLRFGGEYLSASGDKSGTSDKHEGFDNLFPGNHFHYGVNDATIQGVGEMKKLSDLRSVSCNVSLKPSNNWRLRMEYWDFQKENSSDDYGDEINLQLWRKLTKTVSLHMFHSMYRPRDKTGDDPFHKTVVQLYARF